MHAWSCELKLALIAIALYKAEKGGWYMPNWVNRGPCKVTDCISCKLSAKDDICEYECMTNISDCLALALIDLTKGHIEAKIKGMVRK